MSKSFFRTALPAAASLLGFVAFQGAALAGTYQALCNGGKCNVSITGEGISHPDGFMPATRIKSWSAGGSSETDNTTGIITTIAFGLPGLMGFAAKKHDYQFSVSGYDEDGDSMHLSWRFINNKPANRMMSEMPTISGLRRGQRRSIEDIKAIEAAGGDFAVAKASGSGSRLDDATNISNKPRIASSGLGSLKENKLDGIGGPSLPANCWSSYLTSNPAMKQWAEANPSMAAQNKKRFDDC